MYPLRNIIRGLICLCLLFGFTQAADASTVKFTVDSPSYWVDKVEYQMDAAPYIKDGRTYIPIRYVGNVCGIKDENITYDASTRTATFINDAGTEISLQLGVNKIFINGISSGTDAAPELIAGRIYVPVRYAVLAFQKKLYWDEETRSIIIDIGEYLTKAVEQLQNGSFSTALELCDNFLGISPNDSGAHLVKGISLFQLGKMPEAIASFDKSIQMDPKNYLAYLSRAEARWGVFMNDKQNAALTDAETKERLGDVLADVDKSVEVSSEPMMLYCRRAGLHNYMGNYNAAIADCNQAVELDPDYRLAYYRLATAHYFKSGEQAFTSELDKILNKFPDDEWASSCKDILKNKKKFVFDLTDW